MRELRVRWRGSTAGKWYLGFAPRLVIAGLCATALSASARTLFVHCAATTSSGDGLSWATAFASIPPAIHAATAGDEIWVAAGVYRERITLKPGVALYGGFAGLESSRSQRNWTARATILDGGNAVEPASALGGDASASIITILPGATPQTRVDGFTIRNGKSAFGAAIYVAGGSPILANNTLVQNEADGVVGGGAVLLDSTRTPSAPGATAFFRSAADSLLRSELGFGLGNIPIFTNGAGATGGAPLYSPRIHQLLQIAANLWDATHDSPFPTVFRPQFEMRGGDVFITNYVEETGTQFLGRPWRDLGNPADRPIAPDDNVYGIPLVVGAKKGLPNFNELVFQSAIEFSRRLEFRKHATTDAVPFETNQMFIVGISNSFGIEVWNSYTSAYPRALDLVFTNVVTATLTNDDGLTRTATTRTGRLQSIGPSALAGGGFVVPPLAIETLLDNSVYRREPNPAFQAIDAGNTFESGQGFYTNRWGLSVANRLMMALVDGGRVVDVVSLAGLTAHFDLTRSLQVGFGATAIGNCWSLQQTQEVNLGVLNQILVSSGDSNSLASWTAFGELNPASGTDRQMAIDAFRDYLGLPPLFTPAGSLPPRVAVLQAPFTPTRKIYETVSWQANDPLVHHLADDLRDSPVDTIRSTVVSTPFTSVPLIGGPLLGGVNSRYKPWGGRTGSSSDPADYDTRLKDPGVGRSDAWRFPVVGQINLHWLDQVHRGTPWQTLYLDGMGASAAAWEKHRGMTASVATHPTNDWRLVEAFLRGGLIIGPTDASVPVVANNTLVANTALGQGGGIYIVSNCAPVVVNNIIANGSSGVFSCDAVPPAPRNNCVHGNAAYGFSGVAPGLNEIGAPPLFVDPAAGDYRLQSGSPCVDAADAQAITVGWAERSGETAVFGPLPDIGAHEFRQDPLSLPPRMEMSSTDGVLQIRVQGVAGATYAVEASEDLVNWVPLGTNTATTAGLLFTDAAVGYYAHRFYRARVVD